MGRLGCIYRYVNLMNGKGYTGWTTNFSKRKKEHERINGAAPAFHKAIAKYGIENFRCDILEYNTPIERESFWIATFGDYGNGYNLDEGGKGNIGYKWTAQQRQKHSQRMQGENAPNFGKKFSKEHRQNISESLSGENSPMFGKTGERCHNFGKKLSAEHRQKISQATTGKNNPMYGKEFSKDHRQNISKTLKGKYCGEKHPMYGRKHKPESKQKMSEACSGEKNHRFGKTGEKHNSTRPEYMQAKWFFFLQLPPRMDIREKRQRLYKAFDYIDYRVLWRWSNKWKQELENNNP